MTKLSQRILPWAGSSGGIRLVEVSIADEDERLRRIGGHRGAPALSEICPRGSVGQADLRARPPPPVAPAKVSIHQSFDQALDSRLRWNDKTAGGDLL